MTDNDKLAELDKELAVQKEQAKTGQETYRADFNMLRADLATRDAKLEGLIKEQGKEAAERETRLVKWMLAVAGAAIAAFIAYDRWVAGNEAPTDRVVPIVVQIPSGAALGSPVIVPSADGQAWRIIPPDEGQTLAGSGPDPAAADPAGAAGQ